MKKRILVLVMAMTMSLSMVACGQKNDDFYNTTSDCGVDLDCDELYMNYFYNDGFSIYFTTNSNAGDAVTMYQIVKGRG